MLFGIKDKIRIIFENYDGTKLPSKLNPRSRKFNFSDSELELIQHMKHLEFYTICFMIKHNLTTFPKCKFCKTEIKYIKTFSVGFNDICSSNQCKIQKRQKTTLEKYGVENVSQCPNIKKKIKQSIFNKFGEKGLGSLEITDKRRNTSLLRFGFEHPSQSNIIKHKVKSTMFEQYGGFTLTSPILSKKVKSTNVAKYSVENYMQKNINNKHNLTKCFIENNFLTASNELILVNICTYFNLSKSQIYKYLKQLNVNYVRKCNTSHAEDEIFAFISSLTTEHIIQSNKTLLYPLELDILCEDFAIEYNGLMWHSFGKSKYKQFNNYKSIVRTKHLSKTLNCEKYGIQLFHIFENEWLDNKKQLIWKSIIQRKLDINQIHINNDSNCTIYRGSTENLNMFINTNSLLNISDNYITNCLFYNKKLIQIVIKRNNEQNIITKNNYIVSNELTKKLLFDCPLILDRRYNNIKDFQNMGLNNIQYTYPNRWRFIPNSNSLYPMKLNTNYKLKHLFKTNERILYDSGSIIMMAQNYTKTFSEK